MAGKLQAGVVCRTAYGSIPQIAALGEDKRGITERSERHGKVPHIPSVLAECMVLIHGVNLKNEFRAIDHWSEICFAFGRKERAR
jgi:hypothetical protein